MASDYQQDKPRKLTDEEIIKWKKRLAAAEPYPDDPDGYDVFDGPDWDPDRALAQIAKKILKEDRDCYSEYYQNK